MLKHLATFAVAVMIAGHLGGATLVERTADALPPEAIPSHLQNLAIVVVDTARLQDTLGLRDDLRALGFTPVVTYDPNVIVGWSSREATIRAQRHPRVRIAAVDAIVDHPAAANIAGNARLGIDFYNRVKTGRVKDLLPPIGNDATDFPDVVLPHPGKPMNSFTKSGPMRLSTQNHSGWRNDHFEGTIAISVFFVESNGAADANEYTWPAYMPTPPAEYFTNAIIWWAARAREMGRRLDSYTRYYNASYPPDACVSQPYEPVRHSRLDNYKWINAIMSCFGYLPGQPDTIETAWSRVFAHNDWYQAIGGGTGAYSVFMAYNPPELGAPPTFLNGQTAVGYLGGPWFDVLYKNGGYAVSENSAVIAHEMGHMFWACDEYEEICSLKPNCGYCDNLGQGPRPTLLNLNCEATNCTIRTNHNCIMRWHSYPQYAYSNQQLCPSTKAQIGW